MSYDNNARIEILDVTLDDVASFMQTDPNEWSDVSAWFIKVVNYGLDRSQFLGSSITNHLRNNQILIH